MTAQLSPEAIDALINAAGRVGAPVTTGSAATKLELVRLLLITHAGNLTRTGVIARRRAFDARLDAAF